MSDHDQLKAEHQHLKNAIEECQRQIGTIDRHGNDSTIKLDQLVERVAVLRTSHDDLERRVGFFGQSSTLRPEQYPTRTSYSIESEDLLVETIFRAVLKQFTPGTYLDIGAAHPIESSNTYYFYKRGWRGFCVEPNPDLFGQFAELRPEDKAFNVGIAPAAGTFRYHRFEHAFINGFYEQNMVDWHVDKNDQTYLGNAEISCWSIDDFLAQQVDRPIDFLNIDIETLDVEILKNWRWDLCRPTVICAEIHASDVRDVLRSETVTILEQAGYSIVSRGWLSSIFVRTEKLGDAVVIGR